MKPKLPKMIGAHVPVKPKHRKFQSKLYASRGLIAAAFDRWAQKPGRTHLQHLPTLRIT